MQSFSSLRHDLLKHSAVLIISPFFFFFISPFLTHILSVAPGASQFFLFCFFFFFLDTSANIKYWRLSRFRSRLSSVLFSQMILYVPMTSVYHLYQNHPTEQRFSKLLLTAKSGLQPVLLNKVLLDHRHALVCVLLVAALAPQ